MKLALFMALLVIPCCKATDRDKDKDSSSSSSSGGGSTPKVTTIGCDITQSNVNGGNDFWWHVNIWVKVNGTMIEHKVYSVRQGTDRSKAFSDCDKWMKMKSKNKDNKDACIEIK